MAEFSLVPQSAVTRAPELPASSAGSIGVTLTLPPMIGLATVIARKGRIAPLREAVMSVFGIEVPIGPKRAVGAGISFIGTSPGQWLAVGETALVDGLVSSIGSLAAVTDQSDSRALIRIEGPKARAALAKGLPIDLHPDQFQPGDSAVTMMARFAVQLWQLDDNPAFDILVARSSADDFLALLVANAAEYGIKFSALPDAPS